MNPIDLAISQLEDLRQSLAGLELDLVSAREDRELFRVERNKLRARVSELEAERDRYLEALEEIAHEHIQIESEDIEQAARNHWKVAMYFRQQALDALENP